MINDKDIIIIWPLLNENGDLLDLARTQALRSEPLG